MPRVLRRSSGKREPRPVAPVDPEMMDGFSPADEQFVSGDEKRQLILAHVAARSKQQQPLGLGVYAMVGVAAFAVIVGYALTIGANVRAQVPEQVDPLIGTVRESFQKNFADFTEPKEAQPTPAVVPQPAKQDPGIRDQAMRAAAEEITSRSRTGATSTNPSP